MEAVPIIQIHIQACAFAVDGRKDGARLGAELVRGADAARRVRGVRAGEAVIDGEREEVGAATEVGAEPPDWRDFFVHVSAEQGFVHVVAARLSELRALGGLPELFVDVVAAHAAAEGGVEAHAAETLDDAVAHAAAVKSAAIDLLDFVAVLRVDEVEREVREQVEAVGARVGERGELAVFRGAELVAGEDLVARGVAAFARVERPEARNDALFDGARRDLAGAVPVRGVARLAEEETRGGRERHADFVEELVAIPAFWVIEGAVLTSDLDGEKRVRFVPLRARNQEAAVRGAAVAGRAAEAESERAVLEALARDEVDGAGGGEVALVREIGALADVDALDGFRNDEVGVGVALAVGVGHEVDGDAVDGERDVGAVIGVEAAQEILVGFAAARVLHHHEAGRDAQNVLHRADRAQGKVAVAHLGRRRGADRFVTEDERRAGFALERGGGRRRRGAGRRRRGAGRHGCAGRRGDGGGRRRHGAGRRDGRRLEGHAELHGGTNRGAALARRLERPRLHGRDGGFVEAVAGRLKHPRSGDVPAVVDVHLEHDRARDPIGERLRRVLGQRMLFDFRRHGRVRGFGRRSARRGARAGILRLRDTRPGDEDATGQRSDGSRRNKHDFSPKRGPAPARDE